MKKRLTALRGVLEANACDAFISFAPPDNQYLTGFNGTTSGVIVTGDKALFCCDSRYTEQAGDQVADCYEIRHIKGAFSKSVAEALSELKATVTAFEPGYMTVAELQHLESVYTGNLKPVSGAVVELRACKSEDEIDRIAAALQLSEQVLAETLESLEPGITEREIAARFEHGFKSHGASKPSFDTIALFGARSSLPHGQPGDKTLAAGDIALFDFGCVLDGYCSDLTRTCAFGTILGAWFEEIYNLTLEAQLAAIKAVKSGLSCRDVDAVARDLIKDGGYGDHFGHGLGHGLGIEIHESPRLNHESDTILQPGMVVTIEPGIYLPGKGGVRIEDVIVVTESGCRVLSSAPKELKVVQA